MKKCIWLFVCLSIAIISRGQQKDLDSLNLLLENHPQEDTIHAALLINMCRLEYTSDPERNKVHAQQALDVSKKIRYTKGIGQAQKYIAEYYFGTSDYAEATKYGIAMLRTFETTNHHRELGMANLTLGMIYERTRDSTQAKEYLFKALDIFQARGLKADLAMTYNTLGGLYINQHKTKAAIDYLFKSLDIRKELKDEKGMGQSYGNLASVYMNLGDLANSSFYFQKALPLIENSGNKYRLAMNYANFGELLVDQKQYEKAESYLLKAVDLEKSLGEKDLLAETYPVLVVLEKRRGRYEKAVSYLELTADYKDSIYSEDHSRQLSEVHTRFETEKKDQRIVALQQQAELRSLQETYFVAGLISLIIVFAVIYYLQRSNSRKMKAFLEIQQTLNQKLQENDDMKSRFFSNISHEFRTPLSLIIAPIDDKLSTPTLSSQDKVTFQLVKRNANRMLALVNQLLDLSKLDAGKMELRVNKGNLRKFLDVVVASFDSLAENKTIHFIKSIRLDGSERWYDADKLEKIVNNLLFNAFKFTSQNGTVTLSALISPSSGDLNIEVIDTGKGIPEEDQKYVFSPFYQSRHVADDGTGTGLGLSLVKELVKLYGGIVELVSVVGKGTTISVSLPVREEKFAAAVLMEDRLSDLGIDVPDNSATNLDTSRDESENEDRYLKGSRGNSVLIVDDNEDLRNYISSILKARFTTHIASDGEAGFALATEYIPDIIISDVMMPKLNGIDLTERIKRDERTSHIPVVLLTAKADLQSRLEGLKTGADDYLTKPFSPEELQVRIENLIEQRKKLAAKYRESITAEITLVPKVLSMDEKFLQRAMNIVENHISDENFGVEQMAADINLSRTQLFRKLKAISGLSPNEFIGDVRLQKAAVLILLKVDTIAQISYSVGYKEQSYFSKRFRKKFGVSPSEYGLKAKEPAQLS
ncbi:MAG: response regulator [Chryseolinea sp.]